MLMHYLNCAMHILYNQCFSTHSYATNAYATRTLSAHDVYNKKSELLADSMGEASVIDQKQVAIKEQSYIE